MKNFKNITTVEAAFAATGRDINVLSVFDQLPEHDREDSKSSYIRKVFAEAVNEGWEADYNDSNQPKFEVYFWFNGSAFVFAYSNYYYGHTCACCGSRLVFENRERAVHWATHIAKHHNKALMNEKTKSGILSQKSNN